MKPNAEILDYIACWMFTIGTILMFAGLIIVMGRDIGWGPTLKIWGAMAVFVLLILLAFLTS